MAASHTLKLAQSPHFVATSGESRPGSRKRMNTTACMIPRKVLETFRSLKNACDIEKNTHSGTCCKGGDHACLEAEDSNCRRNRKQECSRIDASEYRRIKREY